MRQLKNIRSTAAIATLLCLTIASGARAGTVVQGPIYDPNTNMNLYVLSPESWTAAEVDAQGMGGHLVTIVSAADNAFIVSNVLQNFSGTGGPNLSNVPVWIGLYDPTTGDGTGSQHTANFVWADGSASTYRNWNLATGEPNNNLGGEYYTAINWHFAQNPASTVGTWNDAPDAGTTGFGGNSNGPYYGILEVSAAAPEPASMTLLGLGITGLAGYGWRRRKQALTA